MIFPILSGLRSLTKAPLTWTLFFLNLMMTAFVVRATPDRLDEMMRKRYILRTQGQMYSRYLSARGEAEYPDLLRELGAKVTSHEMDGRELGELAFRDGEFLAVASQLEPLEDKVADRLWRKNLSELSDIEDVHPSFTLGLSSHDYSSLKWVSYIFVHSGWLHFVGNMLMLLIFGAALELQIGGLGLLVVFLLSGLLAAGSFALTTGLANSPLVGASGAISGVIALFCVLNWRRPTRYFYWLFLPFRGYMGFVYLPAWIGFALWVVSDLAGVFGTPAELGGVAHTAHLGGDLAGALIGLILFGLRARRSQAPAAAPGEPERHPPVGQLIPLLPPRPDAVA